MCQSRNLNLCLEVIRGHLVAGGFAQHPENSRRVGKRKCVVFSIMFDSRSVSVQRSSAVLRNVSGNAPTACAHRAPNDAERVFQCQGDESLAAELIISITHGRVAQTSHPAPLPLPLHAHTRWASTTSANQFGSGLLSGLGGTCWEVGTVEERDG